LLSPVPFKISGHTFYTACCKIEALPTCLLSEMELRLLDEFLQYCFLIKKTLKYSAVSLAPSSKLALNICLIKPKFNSTGFRKCYDVQTNQNVLTETHFICNDRQYRSYMLAMMNLKRVKSYDCEQKKQIEILRIIASYRY